MALDPLRLVVCEYAAVHPDGTFTIVRGGVGNWGVPTLPAPLSMYLFVEAPVGAITPGQWAMRFRVHNNGQEVMNTENTLMIGGNPARWLAVQVQLLVAAGRYDIEVLLGDYRGTTSVEVMRADQVARGNK